VIEGDIGEHLPDGALRLEAGDVLLLYTDGYTEAKLGARRIGIEVLSDRFAALCARSLPSAALVAGLLNSVDQAMRPDDVTLVALRCVSGANLHILEQEY